MGALNYDAVKFYVQLRECVQCTILLARTGSLLAKVAVCRDSPRRRRRRRWLEHILQKRDLFQRCQVIFLQMCLNISNILMSFSNILII